mmetsp:Transcript_29709/g.41418  ORF Transcript_29709/g.41418 Transcript_29709/m.41418 type:complete len:104 (+) Transcript_29709:184-495(+)
MLWEYLGVGLLPVGSSLQVLRFKSYCHVSSLQLQGPPGQRSPPYTYIIAVVWSIAAAWCALTGGHVGDPSFIPPPSPMNFHSWLSLLALGSSTHTSLLALSCK